MGSVSRQEQLSKVKIFSGLTDEGLRLLAETSVEEAYPAGATIFEQGSIGNRLFLILVGRVRIGRTMPGIGEEALAVLDAGDVFGEMALLDEATRSADAIAQENCVLLSVTKDQFEDLLFLHKDLAYEVLWNVIRTLIRRLRATNEKVQFLSITDKF
ncbi:MAG: cyclic nucleotide-binding domain-containing protein [Polyangiaceae bacterium]|nr:cyclic nucleotide-binding domain-containing protein [Polyangiaceae bacterium]